MQQVTQVDEGVCYVNEQGQVICSGSSYTEAPASTRSALSDVQALYPALGESALKLIAKFIELVNASQISDPCIGWRAKEIAQSMALLLAPSPPAMLMYHFSQLPANILATYYLHVGQPVNAAYIVREYATTRTACPPVPASA
jgi:hypothetical protein